MNRDEVVSTFVNVFLEGDYNFLEDDLVKLANAFIDKAKPAIVEEERRKCVEVARSFNNLVADKIVEIRG
jgi:hypothetical protein